MSSRIPYEIAPSCPCLIASIRRLTSSVRSTGSSMPTGRPSSTRPKRLPSSRGSGSSSGRRLNGTSACTSSGSVPASRRCAGDRRRDRADQHVVDRRVERARGALDAPEVDRVRPGDAVGGALVALDRRLRVEAGDDQLADRLRVLDRGGERVARMPHDVDRLVCERAGRATERAERRAAVRGGEHVAVRGRLAVGQRQHHAREGDAVGDAVVHPREHRRAVSVAVDQVDLPQRARAVERHRDAVRDEGLQRRAVTRRGQRDVVDVQVEIELDVLPVRARSGPRPGAGGSGRTARRAARGRPSCRRSSRRARRTTARC